MSVFVMLGIVLIMIFLFISELISIDLTALLGLLILTLTGFISPQEAFSGFSSPAIITLAAMFVIGAGLDVTGTCDLVARRVGRIIGGSELNNVLSVMLMGAALSAFMNNVAATAVLLPAVTSLAAQHSLPPSRLLIPLSFSTILGGMCTLIGTSPNILLVDVVRDRLGYELDVFDLSIPGISVALVGILGISLVGRHWLPSKEARKRSRSKSQELSSLYRLYERMFSLVVPEGSPIVGRTLAETRFGEVLRVQVVALYRGGTRILQPASNTVLKEGDRLLVQGRLSRFESLSNLKNLIVIERTAELDNQLSRVDLSCCYQVTGRELAGKTLRDLKFRDRYRLVVLGIQREDRLFSRNLGDVVLREGDLLQLIGAEDDIKLLLDRNVITQAQCHSSGFDQVSAIKVSSESPCVGLKVRDTKLGEILDLRVFGLYRANNLELVYDGSQVLESGDLLLVMGDSKNLEALGELTSVSILEDSESPSIVSEEIGLVEVVLSPRSSLIGRTLVEADFKEKYGFNVLAIWREARPYRSRVASRVLKFGDALLLHGPIDKLSLLKRQEDVVVLREGSAVAVKPMKIVSAVLALVCMSVLSIFKIFPVHFSAFIGALIVICTGVVSMEEAYRKINWRILVLVAAMVSLGPAMDHSGTNQFLADILSGVLVNLGPIGVLVVMCIVSSILSQSLDSVVPVILLSPIAIATSEKLNLEPLPLLLGIALSASIAFMTPFSHKANLLVMSAGGYRSRDYLKIGSFLTVISLVVLIVVLVMFHPLVSKAV